MRLDPLTGAILDFTPPPFPIRVTNSTGQDAETLYHFLMRNGPGPGVSPVEQETTSAGRNVRLSRLMFG